MLPKDIQEKLKDASKIEDEKAKIREIDRIADIARGRCPECFVEDDEEEFGE